MGTRPSVPCHANNDEEEMSEYLRQLEACRSLKPSEEHELIAGFADPDNNPHRIREQLVEAHLPLVVEQARRYQHLGVPLSELIAEGNLALVKAARSFHPAPHQLFRPYAARCVHLRLLGVVVEHTHGFHLPSWAKNALYQLNHHTFHRFLNAGFDLLDEHLRTAVGLSEEQTDALQRLKEPPLSLDAVAPWEYGPGVAPWFKEGMALDGEAEEPADVRQTLLEIITARHAWIDEEETARLEQRIFLQQGLAQLPPRHRQALELCYGLGADGREHTLEEAGRILGVSRERVRQLVVRAERALRHYFRFGRTDFTWLLAYERRFPSPRASSTVTSTRPPKSRRATSQNRPQLKQEGASSEQPSPEQANLPAQATPPLLEGLPSVSFARRGFMDRSRGADGKDTTPRAVPPLHTISPGPAVSSGWHTELSNLIIGKSGQGRSYFVRNLLHDLEQQEKQPDPTSHKPVEDNVNEAPIHPLIEGSHESIDSVQELELLDQVLPLRCTAAQRSCGSAPSSPQLNSIPSPLFHTCRIETFAWSPDGLHLALVDQGGHLSIYDLATGLTVGVFHQQVAALPLCCWSPDSKYIATASQGCGLWVREVATKRVRLYDQGHRHQIRALAWSPDGNHLASADRSNIHLIEPLLPRPERCVLKKTLRWDAPLRLAWSPDGSQLATVTRARWRVPLLSRRDQVRLWDMQNGQSLHIHHVETGAITDVAWSADGCYMATIGDLAHIWSARTGQLVASGQTSDKGSRWVRWRGDDTLAILSRSGAVDFLHATTGAGLARYHALGKDITCADWSPDGSVLAFTEAGRCTVFFWRRP